MSKELRFDMTKVNVHRDAIALWHAISASGTRILTTPLYAMQRQQAHYDLVILCIGGAQGVTVIVE